MSVSPFSHDDPSQAILMRRTSESAELIGLARNATDRHRSCEAEARPECVSRNRPEEAFTNSQVFGAAGRDLAEHRLVWHIYQRGIFDDVPGSISFTVP